MSDSVKLRLSTGQRLPDLRIVPSSQIFLHEDGDPGRVERLGVRLRGDGILRNPPIVAPMPAGGYVVLDGANRTSALDALGVRAIPVQVVPYDDEGVRLEVWRHFLIDAAGLAGRLEAAALAVRPVSASDAVATPGERGAACSLVTAGGTFDVLLEGGRPLAATLSRVVDAYRGAAKIYRVLTHDLSTLAREYGAGGTVVVFPPFTKADILQIAQAPAKLPTGITRHVISGRALRVNVPLETLRADGGIEEKNRWLGDLIRQKLLDNQIRYYPEASFLFDE